MRRVLLVIGNVVGVLEILGVGLWCLAGAGMYGSPLVGMSGRDLAKIIAFFLMGPLLVLPACILARSLPKPAGLLLLVTAVVSGLWHIMVVMSPFGVEQLLRGEPAFEALVPLALVSLPMMLLGAAYLCLPGMKH